MRPFITVLATIFVLSLPMIAQAGDGCPYSKQEVTTASTEAEAADASACAASCAHAETTAAATGCVCPGEATASLQTDQADDPHSTDSAQDVAAND